MGIHDFARGSVAKRAYHRLALEWHPDRQVHATEHRQKEAEDVFKASKCIRIASPRVPDSDQAPWVPGGGGAGHWRFL